MRPKIGISMALDSSLDEPWVPATRLWYVNDEPAQAVEQSGGLPVPIPFLSESGLLNEFLDGLDGVFITGGIRSLAPALASRQSFPDLQEQNPSRYAYDTLLIRRALERQLPILGICRGMQMLNEVTGGTMLRQVPNPEYHRTPTEGPEQRHAISVVPTTTLAQRLPAATSWVNSYHVQSVQTTGTDMRICAMAEDGIVEAIESRDGSFVLGLQFHPEKMMDHEVGQSIFAAFIRAAAGFRSCQDKLESAL